MTGLINEINAIARAREGDRIAQTEVAEALRPRLERMAVHYARRCGEDADDLLQEAWLGLLDALPGVDLRIGCPKQYLLRRAKWRLLDCVKRNRIRRCQPLDDAWAPATDGGHAAALGEENTREFVGRLNATQQRIVECLLEGMTWREAGDVLGCTSANVAYHMRQIRREYADWAGEMPACSARVKTL